MLLYGSGRTFIVDLSRCVAEQQRALALGLQCVVWRTFGSILGPILFGGLFDSACIYWQDECGRRGNCWVYENMDLSERALSVGLIGVFLRSVHHNGRPSSLKELEVEEGEDGKQALSWVEPGRSWAIPRISSWWSLFFITVLHIDLHMFVIVPTMCFLFVTCWGRVSLGGAHRGKLVCMWLFTDSATRSIFQISKRLATVGGIVVVVQHADRTIAQLLALHAISLSLSVLQHHRHNPFRWSCCHQWHTCRPLQLLLGTVSVNAARKSCYCLFHPSCPSMSPSTL